MKRHRKRASVENRSSTEERYHLDFGQERISKDSASSTQDDSCRKAPPNRADMLKRPTGHCRGEIEWSYRVCPMTKALPLPAINDSRKAAGTRSEEHSGHEEMRLRGDLRNDASI